MSKGVVEQELLRLPLDDLISLLQERMTLQSIVSQGMDWPSGTVNINSASVPSLAPSIEKKESNRIEKKESN